MGVQLVDVLTLDWTEISDFVSDIETWLVYSMIVPR